MFFSIIIPVYNRPNEINELLNSLINQTYKDFEVIIIEDGSHLPCDTIIANYRDAITITYIIQKNTGQGFARNNGMKIGRGDFFIMFDSDCVIPPHYLSIVAEQINLRNLDAFGGPDQADNDFSPFQKAINYSMTSLFTTGGIRGKLKDPKKFQARSFNMGISHRAFIATGGFVDPNRGEDIELSIRLRKLGFELELIKEAFVFHKRRNTFISFLNQSFSFGRNRVNVSRFHAEAIKPVHFLPLMFLIGVLLIPILYFIYIPLFYMAVLILIVWSVGVVIGSTLENKAIGIGLLSLPIAIGQLFSYGTGLAFEWIIKEIKG